jgi:transcription elongation factor GreA
MTQKRPMTPYGYSLLRQELLKLKSQRAELAQAIEVARAHGDISENADYDAAKEKSGMVEARIRDLELKLATADVIDPKKISESQKVVFGVSVRIEDIDSGEIKKITIVGAEESNVEKGYISFEAPIGRALIGKEIGDVAKVKAPNGEREYEIIEILIDFDEVPVEV